MQCANSCQPGSSGVACRCVYKLVHHAQAYVVERGPLQLTEHPGDAACVLPAVTNVPGRTPLHDLQFMEVVFCWSHIVDACSTCGLGRYVSSI